MMKSRRRCCWSSGWTGNRSDWNVSVIRLLSYNIHKGIGGRDRRYRLERIIEVIRAESPDIICLQEVDRDVRRSRFHDQALMLAEEFTAVAHLYQLNVRVQRGGYGNLLLSRWPLRHSHQISLTRHGKKPRGAQIAVIESEEGPLQVVNWHLGLSEQERHWQVRHLLRHHLFRESAHLPSILIGDTNDWRDTLERGPFSIHGFHQITRPLSRFRSFPAYLPLGALDKAFARGNLVVEHAKVSQRRVARDASDHLPLIIDVRLTAPST